MRNFNKNYKINLNQFKTLKRMRKKSKKNVVNYNNS